MAAGPLGPGLNLETMQVAIVTARPDLAGSRFTPLTHSWDSVAIDVDDTWIFKFPRSEVAAKALLREAGLLARIRPAVAMALPDLAIHQGPPLFSSHRKLPGEHLESAGYALLPDAARARLAADLARFYADLHGLDTKGMVACGATRIGPWWPVERIRAVIGKLLPAPLKEFADKTLESYAFLAPDPYGDTYGFFDGHGWNMAFDHERGRLNGIYDFADSGLGPLHQEFVYSSMISPDLTARMIDAYEPLSGRRVDRRRVEILTATHRLWELAEMAGQPEHLAHKIKMVAAWATHSTGHGT
jgi:hypothetical protein